MLSAFRRATVAWRWGAKGQGARHVDGQEKVTTRVFGALDRAWTSVCWPLIGLLNLFFRPDPQTGHVALWKVALWLVANGALLYAAVDGLTTQPLFWTLSAFLLVHILIIASQPAHHVRGKARHGGLAWPPTR